jgi:hypothetical protein
VARGKTKIEDLKTKFTSLVDKIGVPVQVGFVKYYPNTGMQEFFF